MVMFEVISRTTPFAGASSVALAQIVICGAKGQLFQLKELITLVRENTYN